MLWSNLSSWAILKLAKEGMKRASKVSFAEEIYSLGGKVPNPYKVNTSPEFI